MKKLTSLKCKDETPASNASRVFFLCLMLLAILLSVPLNAQGQQNSISGQISDAANKEPLVGVSVIVKGTTTGILTDIDGKFSIAAPVGSTLVITYIGFVKQEIPITNRTPLNILLKEDSQLLEDVVVIGYGTTTRKNFTGSFTQVKMENSPLSLIPSPNALDALRGTVPGLTVGQQQGAGQSPDLQIRGQRSVNGNNSPLIVLDGVIFMGAMRDIDPSVIETMQVLKDATTIAAYGTRAANGVVMINTKRGKLGKPVISLHSSLAFSEMVNRPDLLSAENYIKKVNLLSGLAEDADPLTWMKYFERDNYLAGRTTDWMDEVSRTGMLQNYNLSISGATDKTNYFLSLTHDDQKGVLIGDDYSRQAFVARVETDITNWLKIGTAATYSFNNYSGATNYDIYQAIRLSPYGSVYRNDGSGLPEKYPVGEGIYRVNPLWNMNSNTIDDHDTFQTYRTEGFALVKCPWIDGLSYRFNYAYSNQYIERDYFTHEGNYVKEVTDYANEADRYLPTNTAAFLSSANGYSTRQRNTSWVMDNIVNYTKSIGKHLIDLTYVYTRDSYQYRSKKMSAKDFAALGNTNLGYNGLAFATTTNVNEIGSYKKNNIGYLGRLNYNYDSKYFVTASVRRDGASVFGVDKKWGSFPAIGIGWTASNESFLKKNATINYLKLKASWGKNGNQGLDSYKTLSEIALGQKAGYSYPFGNNSSVSWGQRLSSIGNTSLAWETTTAVNGGFEISLLNNRINVDVDAYKSKTEDQIFSRLIPVMGNGVTSMLATMGRVNNWGIEATLNTTNIKTKDLEWNTTLIYFLNRNKLVELYGDGKDDITNSLFLGKSLGAIYGYKIIGIVQEDDTEYIAANNAKPGDAKFANTDESEDGKISATDRSILGYKKENFRMSLGNTLRYKDFELYMLFTGIFGGGGYFQEVNYYAFATASDVVGDNTFNHAWWTAENRNNEYPRINYTDSRYRPLQSRTFVRLQDLSLSYTFRQPWVKKMKINSLKVYGAAKNVFTFSKWDGGDPETAQTLGTGYSYGYPLARTYSFGINLTF
ncbi:TonB-linked SusC/RagA family outer membrane protein [Dysgonomonas alginatilytica]|uniref:TonB-linked SusC/RagA family outer membrane protein n=1 Tax=Dysgonomonas alginatilytica TaxID=1605892 RepID=A0A2V3PLQ7_9BACT|nr:TonB-dependent receptor [Dysgonomonas alginatilytica]PXV60181.1 TonB-linked SusC/RagA family outer membrane protein [Dysgonomonas alginatilytica]